MTSPRHVAVVAVQAYCERLFVVAGATARLGIDLHEALGHELHRLASASTSAPFSASSASAMVRVVIVVSFARTRLVFASQTTRTHEWPPRPGQDCRRAASRYGLRPTGSTSTACRRTQRLTPLPGARTRGAWRPRWPPTEPPPANLPRRPGRVLPLPSLARPPRLPQGGMASPGAGPVRDRHARRRAPPS